jgi:hypothetical protein
MNKFFLFFVLLFVGLSCKEAQKSKFIAVKEVVNDTIVSIVSEVVKKELDIRVVILESGIVARLTPSFKAKNEFIIPFGVQLEVIQILQNDSIIQNSKVLNGTWLKVKYYQPQAHWSAVNCPIYVFSSVVEPIKNTIERIEKEFSQFKEFNNCKLDTNAKPTYLIGDFFGDAILDKAIMVKYGGKTKVKVINYTKNNAVVHDFDDMLENGVKHDIDDYYWADQFEIIPPLSLMQATAFDSNSNIITDSVALSTMPIFQVPYNSIFVHNTESCGGASIYWKNGSFHWVQNE